MVSVSAHRGGSETTKPAPYDAYNSAVRSGAEYAEFDIRKTLDDVMVVYHDVYVARTSRPVRDVSYDELCDHVGYEVPKVSEVMGLLGGKVIGHLDLKEVGYEEEVINLAMRTFGPQNFVATTLEDVSIVNIKRAYPEAKTALSLGRNLNDVPRSRRLATRRSEIFPMPRLHACGADWAAINYRLARYGIINTCRRNGIGVMVWTVDAYDLIDQFLADRRISVLITNRPGYAVARRATIASKISR
jgi:glycerophosphoryl diester phosphodiesterase